MRRLSCRRWVILSGVVVLAGLLLANGREVTRGQSREETIAAGRRVFAGSCGMAYCHGSDGAGGGGPRLRDRRYSAAKLRQLISEGIRGTAMPAFGKDLKAEQISQLVTFLLSMNREVAEEKPNSLVEAHLGGSGGAEKRGGSVAAARPAEKPGVTRQEKGSGVAGDWRAGESIFFDAAEMGNCRGCHTIHGRGGRVASDLSRLSSEPPREILRRLLAPRASDNGQFATIAVTLKSGEKVSGILRDESETALRVFDTATLPPISRNYLREEIAAVARPGTSGCPGGYAARFSIKQILDLISFIRTSDPSQPAIVSLEEILGQP